MAAIGLLPKEETTGGADFGGVACAIAHRLDAAALEAVVVFAFGLGGGGPPNPIEAKMSPSSAPIRVFFLGLATDVGLAFFGPRLVMPIFIPPIVAGISCEGFMAAVVVVAAGVGTRGAVGGVSVEEAETAEPPPDLGATGRPREDAGPPFPLLLIKLIPDAPFPPLLLMLLPLTLLEADPA